MIPEYTQLRCLTMLTPVCELQAAGLDAET
jgi:hypothetical protein